MNNTFVPSTKDINDKKWYIVDADGVTLGRLATKVSEVLRGKHKVTFTPFQDMGDYVIVVNAEKIKVTGKKLDQKYYFHHTGWIGGEKYITLKDQLKKKPELVIEHAVKGMLPKGPLGRKMYKKLFVYPNATHKHEAQKPIALNI